MKMHFGQCRAAFVRPVRFGLAGPRVAFLPGLLLVALARVFYKKVGLPTMTDAKAMP